jgi:hypothetical protein
MLSEIGQKPKPKPTPTRSRVSKLSLRHTAKLPSLPHQAAFYHTSLQQRGLRQSWDKLGPRGRAPGRHGTVSRVLDSGHSMFQESRILRRLDNRCCRTVVRRAMLDTDSHGRHRVL